MTTVPVLNVSLMEATMAQIHAEPEKWSQDYYGRDDRSCGTTMCFAGTAVTLAGATIVWGQRLADWCITADGTQRPICEYATEVLGLTGVQASELFLNFTNDADVLHRHVKGLIESAQSAAI